MVWCPRWLLQRCGSQFYCHTPYDLAIVCLYIQLFNIREWKIALTEKSIVVAKMSIVALQSPSHVQLFATPWTAACHTSLSLTISWELPKFMSIESVISSNHLILCCLLLLLPSNFPSTRVFLNELVFASSSQSIGVSASASVLSMSIQIWFPLGKKGFP